MREEMEVQQYAILEKSVSKSSAEGQWAVVSQVIFVGDSAKAMLQHYAQLGEPEDRYSSYDFLRLRGPILLSHQQPDTPADPHWTSNEPAPVPPDMVCIERRHMVELLQTWTLKHGGCEYGDRVIRAAKAALAVQPAPAPRWEHLPPNANPVLIDATDLAELFALGYLVSPLPGWGKRVLDVAKAAYATRKQ